MFICRKEDDMSDNKFLNDEVELCEFMHAHEDTLKSVKDQMPHDEDLFDLAELFKIFGDSTRIKILYILFESEMCVCDIATLIGASQSAVSHQLRLLKQANLIKPRRDGKTVFYSLSDDHVRTIINNGMEHIFEKSSDTPVQPKSAEESLIESILKGSDK